MVYYHKIIVGVIILLLTLTIVVTFIIKKGDESLIEILKLALKSLGNLLVVFFVLSIFIAGLMTLISGLSVVIP